MSSLRWAGFVLVLTLFAGRPTLPFSSEKPAFPIDGNRVARQALFMIEADGSPEKGERYRIEIARDSKFETIDATFTSGRESPGWSMANQKTMEIIPEKYRPEAFNGIRLRTTLSLEEGEHFWRVSKSIRGGPFETISRPARFTFDTTPPAPVERIQIRPRPEGGLVLKWDPVTTDAKSGPEEVAGYRVYRFNTVLHRYPTMTRYLVTETTDTQVELPGKKGGGGPGKVSFFLIQAVDSSGNEEGRFRPQALGSLNSQYNPPDLNALTDPQSLRDMNTQARAEEAAEAAKKQ